MVPMVPKSGVARLSHSAITSIADEVRQDAARSSSRRAGQSSAAQTFSSVE